MKNKIWGDGSLMEDKNKLQEDIIKADIKSVEKLWKNAVDENTLDALLSKMTKDELVKVAKKYSVKGMTTLKKADAVEKLKNVIVESQDKLLASLEENTLKFLIDFLLYFSFIFYLHSGKPATLVSNDNPPDNTVAEITIGQLTALITAVLPIVAIAV